MGVGSPDAGGFYKDELFHFQVGFKGYALPEAARINDKDMSGYELWKLLRVNA